MRHYIPPEDPGLDPRSRHTQLARLFAIQRQIWRQNGMRDHDGDHPLTSVALLDLRETARASLTRRRMR